MNAEERRYIIARLEAIELFVLSIARTIPAGALRAEFHRNREMMKTAFLHSGKSDEDIAAAESLIENMASGIWE